MEQVIIIGSGPAGLTSAIYCARAALEPLVVAGIQPGGQLTTTTVVENWPGFVGGVDGPKLMEDMRTQAEHLGVRFATGPEVSRIAALPSQEGFLVELSDSATYKTKVVIVATGASALTLPLPQKDKLMGYGLSTCAVCDGFFYRNKRVVVVGGGDSAMEEASHLAKLASEVVLVHRKDSFRASKAMQTRILSNPKVRVFWNTEVIDTTADSQGLTGVIFKDIKTGETRTWQTDGLFMAIGHRPNTSFLQGVVELDDQGYVVTHNGTHTTMPGIFAAGDVEDRLYRQAITASGRGCQAALQAERYLAGH